MPAATIPKICPICTITPMACPACEAYADKGTVLGIIEEAAQSHKEQADEIARLKNRLAEYQEEIARRDESIRSLSDGLPVSATMPALGCGCHITGNKIVYFWHHCPLHAAAVAMKAALQDLYECNVWYGPIDGGDKARLLKAREAIRMADGRR